LAEISGRRGRPPPTIFARLGRPVNALHRVPTVRESQGILRESGKTQRVREKSLDQLFMHYFHNFCRLLGALPPDPQGGSAPVNTAG